MEVSQIGFAQIKGKVSKSWNMHQISQKYIKQAEHYIQPDENPSFETEHVRKISWQSIR